MKKNQSAVGDRQSATRKGFTFIEVLFAIIILGIGMIMLAGMLPVAISQTAQARDQITGKAAVEAGYAYLKAVARSNPNAFPPTNENAPAPLGLGLISNSANQPLFDLLQGSSGPYQYSAGNVAPNDRRAGRVVPLTFNVIESLTDSVGGAKRSLQSVQGSRVMSSDPQIQWTAFYRRDAGSNVVQLTILSLHLQNREFAERYSDDTLSNEAVNSRNGPFLVPVEIEDRLAEPDVIKFVGNNIGTNDFDKQVAGTGAYVIIAHSPPPTDGNSGGPHDMRRPFRNNGQVFRLAARRDDLDSTAGGARVWELDPEFDLESAKIGIDNVPGSPDDVPDGSMNTTNHFEIDNAAPINRASNNRTYDGAAGTTAWAWIIGKGLIDPRSASGGVNTYQGAAQDITVLKVNLVLE